MASISPSSVVLDGIRRGGGRFGVNLLVLVGFNFPCELIREACSFPSVPSFLCDEDEEAMTDSGSLENLNTRSAAY